ncbi:MAG TPA: glycosyltransferase family 4 protein [Flavitalea sp.]|nr:glycosyltransferase family 4 protein [Flavitalea sp.]
MVIVLFGQHFAEYITSLGGAFPAEEKVVLFLSKKNVQEEIPTRFQGAITKNIDSVLTFMPGPGKPYAFLQAVRLFRRTIRKLQPHVIHFQEMPKGYTFVCWLLARKSLRVLTIHDVVSHPGGDSKTTFRQDFFKKYMRKSADRLIVHGQKLVEQIEMVYPDLAPKTRIVPHPVLRLPTLPVNQSVIENQLLFFGRISKYKGLKYLAEACVKLQDKGKQFSLVVAGKGDDFAANETALKKINQVTIINRRIHPDEIDKLFEAADIVVLPYIEASQSGVIAYALAFGKPCVASRTGCIPDMIRHNYNGLLTIPADAESLADGLEQLMDNKELKQAFSDHALSLAASEFAPATIAKETMLLYEDLLKPIQKDAVNHIPA